MLLYNSVEFELAPADVLIYAPRNNPEVKMAIENSEQIILCFIQYFLVHNAALRGEQRHHLAKTIVP